MEGGKRRGGGGGGGGGGIDHVLRKIKTALSQFTKNMNLAFHASRKTKENIWKITVHDNFGNHDSRGKKGVSHFTGTKKG